MPFVTGLGTAVLPSMMVRVVDRGYSMNALPQFVVRTLLAAIVAVVTRYPVAGPVDV